MIAMLVLLAVSLKCEKGSPTGTSDDGAIGDAAGLDAAAGDGATADGAPVDGASVDGARVDGALTDAVAPDGGDDDGGTSTFHIMCGFGICNGPQEVCCATQVGQNYQYDCVAPGTCGGIGWVECDQSDDCGPAESCCFLSGPQNAICVSGLCGLQTACVTGADCPGTHPNCCLIGGGPWQYLRHCSDTSC
jgi:hypothetical protein